MHLTDAESRRSSVISQRSESALFRNPPGALAPEWAAAARYSTSDPISPTATIRSESRQPTHNEEARSCQPDYLPGVHENTPQPESEVIPDVARGTALNTALAPDPYEDGSVQPEQENESHLASADGAPADMAASASREAENSPEEGLGHVIQGSPADSGGGVAIPETIQRLRTRRPKTKPAKRRRGRDGTTYSATATSGEEVPTYKRRKVAASGGLGCRAQSALGPAQKPRTRASDRSTSRRSAGTSISADALPPDEIQATDHTDANYQEWPLPDAVLQRIQVNGRAILQLQFTWTTPCASHTASDARPGRQPSVLPPTRRDRGARTRASKSGTTNRGTERVNSCNTGGENDVHAVARLLARWKRGTYLLEWADGTTSWEPKRNILDRHMIDGFEATYRGFNAGVDVFASRTYKGREQWRVHWHGRPAAEDCWVDGKLMDPARVEKVQASGFDSLPE